MREVLFRGKSIDTGEWLVGDLTHTSDSELAQIWVRNEYGGLDNYLVDAGTVGQYTGLRDKNGKRIFEGDIAHCKDLRNPYSGPQEFIAEFGFENGSFYTNNGWITRYNLTEYEYEVIGNIPDDPELLGGEERETD